MMMFSEMLEMVSRTFALSINYLPPVLREPVSLAYLLFRVSDGLEDHTEMMATRKAYLLEQWNQVIQGQMPAFEFVQNIADLDRNNPEIFVAQQAPDLIAALAASPEEVRDPIVARVSEATQGMARWQLKGPFVTTLADMDDYMHHVAGLVGYLMTDLFSWYSSQFRAHSEELLPLSHEIGLGLQTVNIIRGLRSDYQRGWVFVPQEMLSTAGINREQFFLPDFEDRALQVVNLLIDKAEQHLQYGITYISAFPWWNHRLRLACIWPLCFALKTLALSRDNVEVLRSEVKITRRDVKEIMRQTFLLGWSDRWLYGYVNNLVHSSHG
jgi:farnesyl-diphosphate farnesyltransferase